MTKFLTAPRPETISGYLCPFHLWEQPVLMQFPQATQKSVVVFSDAEKLRKCMDEIGIAEYKIKQVQDGEGFAESIFAAGLRLAANPYRFEKDGKPACHWTEILPPDDAEVVERLRKVQDGDALERNEDRH